MRNSRRNVNFVTGPPLHMIPQSKWRHIGDIFGPIFGGLDWLVVAGGSWLCGRARMGLGFNFAREDYSLWALGN